MDNQLEQYKKVQQHLHHKKQSVNKLKAFAAHQRYSNQKCHADVFESSFLYVFLNLVSTR